MVFLLTERCSLASQWGCDKCMQREKMQSRKKCKIRG